MTTYAVATQQAAAVLGRQYLQAAVEGGNFWFLGNALHAYLRALLATGSQDTGGLLKYALEYPYSKLEANPGIWRDDYGWWGCAFCAAIRNRGGLGYASAEWDGLFNELLAAAESCWNRIEENWIDGPYSSAYDHAIASASDIVGGVANDKASTTDLAGRNTVTNAGFWLLSIELGKVTGDQKYFDGTRAISSWFDKWFVPNSSRRGLQNDAGLMLERPTGNARVPDWHWTGDQGVLMIDLLRQAQANIPPPYTNTAGPKLAAAVVRAAGTSMLLEEWLGFRPKFDEFGVDYATGKGILMRHLADVCQDLGLGWTESVCGEFIRTNAREVWRGRKGEPATGPQLPFNWGTAPVAFNGHEKLQPLVFQASGLDALSAAARFWPKDPID